MRYLNKKRNIQQKNRNNNNNNNNNNNYYYLYGEAWDFGEVALGQRGFNASQLHVAGSGIGAFNDRMRDGSLGGSPFAPPDFQGVVTGLALAPNDGSRIRKQQGDHAATLRELLVLSDWIRCGLTGNLRDFEFETFLGVRAKGGDLRIHNQPLAYGVEPQEHVAFLGCHDNMTIFDIVTEKADQAESSESRARMVLLCHALVAFSQGVPFFHAGDDLLRSKNLDRDSYNSGDWFNRVDWTGSTNFFGSGLPVETKNGGQWEFKGTLLREAKRLAPTKEIIQRTHELFKAYIRIRYDSVLWRLPSAENIKRQVRLFNTGPRQVLGVLAVVVDSLPKGEVEGEEGKGEEESRRGYDPKYEQVYVVFNCAPYEVRVDVPADLCRDAAALQLHPILDNPKLDPITASARVEGGGPGSNAVFVVPGRTTAVFVLPRK
mmetsp:Transcript_15982/g.28696  ORF Transcript_15982/g.28696 Transcript_15982/m.28696 type:complete len:432 (-) Transcript_15982:269-1564(-)